jgi:hypothetical protein
MWRTFLKIKSFEYMLTTKILVFQCIIITSFSRRKGNPANEAVKYVAVSVYSIIFLCS